MGDPLDDALGLSGDDPSTASTSDPLDAALGLNTAASAASAPASSSSTSPLRYFGAMALRGGLPILGGIAGAALGGPVGLAAGGAGGGSLGEYLAEKLEGREKINPWEVAGEGALGAVPLGAEASAGRAALKAGSMAGLDVLGRSVAEQGLPTSLSDVSTRVSSAVPAAVIAAATGGVVHHVFGAPRAPVETAPESTIGAGPRRVALSGPPPAPGPVTAAEPTLYAPSGDLPTTTGITQLDQILGIDPSRLTERRAATNIVRETTAPPSTTRPPFGGMPEVTPTGESVTPDMAGTDTFEPGAPQGRPPTAASLRKLEVPQSIRDTFPGVFDEPSGTPQADDPFTPTPTPPVETHGPGDFGRLDIPDVLTRILHGEEPPADLSGLSLRGDEPTALNGSGDSSASLEALSRDAGMKSRGESFAVYDRAGNKRPILGPDAVDYHAQPGETFGVDSPGGFSVFDANGGHVPPGDLKPTAAPASASSASLDFMPEPIRRLYQSLQPEWEQTVASQAGDDIPFTVDPRETPEEFNARVQTSDPRALMGGERKAVAELPPLDTNETPTALGEEQQDEQPTDLRGELGAASPRLLAPLAGGAVGSAVGAATNPNDRKAGAVEGALAGASIPLALMHPDVAAKLRYFSLLGSPVTIAKKAASDLASAGTEAATRALTGHTQGAKNIVSSFLSPETVNALKREWASGGVPSDPSIPSGTFGKDTSGVLGLPSRAMKAITGAAQDAYGRAGLSPAEAERLTFTSQPETAAGRALNRFANEGGPIVDAVMPFVRTATNIAEQGSKFVPGLGYASLLSKALKGESAAPGEMGTATAKQLLGLLAAGYGATKTPSQPQNGIADKLYHAGMGPLMIPEAMGEAMGAVSRGKHDDPNAELNAGVKALIDALPIPTSESDFYPSNILPQFIPNALSLASRVPPGQFDTTNAGPLGPTVAKIPLLNELLLRQRKPLRPGR